MYGRPYYIVTVYEAAGLTASENKNGDHAAADTEPGNPDLAARHRSSGTEGYIDGRCRFCPWAVSSSQALTVRGKPEIARRMRLSWACYNRFKRELYGMLLARSTSPGS